MSFLNQLGDLGGEILDTTTQIVGGIGDDIESKADANEVIIAKNKAVIEIEKAKAAEKIRRSRQMEKVAIYSVAAAFAILLLVVGSNVYLKIQKSK